MWKIGRVLRALKPWASGAGVVASLCVGLALSACSDTASSGPTADLGSGDGSTPGDAAVCRSPDASDSGADNPGWCVVDTLLNQALVVPAAIISAAGWCPLKPAYRTPTKAEKSNSPQPG